MLQLDVSYSERWQCLTNSIIPTSFGFTRWVLCGSWLSKGKRKSKVDSRIEIDTLSLLSLTTKSEFAWPPSPHTTLMTYFEVWKPFQVQYDGFTIKERKHLIQASGGQLVANTGSTNGTPFLTRNVKCTNFVLPSLWCVKEVAKPHWYHYQFHTDFRNCLKAVTD